MKHFFPLISFFTILLAGCSNGVEIEGNVILVEKRFGEENKYEQFKEITNQGTVQKAKDILENINWEQAEVSMAYPPHYKFRFKGNKEQVEGIYDLWISPNKEQVELVKEGEGKYVQLNSSESSSLIEIITGVNLSEVK